MNRYFVVRTFSLQKAKSFLPYAKSLTFFLSFHFSGCQLFRLSLTTNDYSLLGMLTEHNLPHSLSSVFVEFDWILLAQSNHPHIAWINFFPSQKNFILKYFYSSID